MTLQLSEIDYPPCWPDRHSLRVTASGCMLTEEQPGVFQVWLVEPRLREMLAALPVEVRDDFAVWFQADLAEAVDAFIGDCPEPNHLLDWALHLELLAAQLRNASRGDPSRLEPKRDETKRDDSTRDETR